MARTEFSQRIVDVIKAIPSGRVATYGGIATAAGNPRAARTVVWILNSVGRSKNEELPWHRVINSKGTISLESGAGYELQRSLLEAEGVAFGLNGRVDLNTYQWDYCFPAKS